MSKLFNIQPSQERLDKWIDLMNMNVMPEELQKELEDGAIGMTDLSVAPSIHQNCGGVMKSWELRAGGALPSYVIRCQKGGLAVYEFVVDLEFFREELDMIEDETLREITKLALMQAPDWFWETSASSSGRHHAPEDRDKQGNLRHSAKVAWVAWKFFEAFGINPDLGMVPGLLHDIQKYGPHPEPNRDLYFKNHDIAAATWLESLEFISPNWVMKRKTQKFTADWRIICACVRTHMGRYGSQAKEFFTEGTVSQRLFHCADLTAASKTLTSLKFSLPDLATPLHEALDRRFYFSRTDEGLTVNFGKYAGKTVAFIGWSLHEQSYLTWILNQFFIPEYQKNWLREEMNRVKEEEQKRLAFKQGNLFVTDRQIAHERTPPVEEADEEEVLF